MAAAKDGKLEGPCGPVGTYDAAQAVLAKGPMKLTEIERKGSLYTPVGMSLAVELAANGDAIQHMAGTTSPVGHVSGVTDEAARDRFRALVAVAVTLETKLSLETIVPEIKLSWNDGSVEPAELTQQKAANSVTVTYAAGHYDVVIDTPEPDTYAKTQYTVTEAKDGTLSFGDKPFARIPDRHACKPHDHVASELLRAFLGSRAGFQYLRAHELPEPPPPPPRRPPRPKGAR